MRGIPPILVALGLTSTLPAGATFVNAGDSAQQVAVLLEGAVELDDWGTIDVPGTLLTPGLLGGGMAPATLRALTPVALLVVDAGDLRAVASESDVAGWLAYQSAAWTRGKPDGAVEPRTVGESGAGGR